MDKPFRSSTAGIKKWTFNTGQNKYAAQFTLHRKEVGNYIQRTLPDEGYLVAQAIKSRIEQLIALPPPVDQSDPGKNDGDKTEAPSDDVSTMTGKTSGEGAQTNSKGESHCFNCGSPSHWAYKCPQLSGEQQAQLHMNQEAQEDATEEQAGEEGRQMMHVTFTRRGIA